MCPTVHNCEYEGEGQGKMLRLVRNYDCPKTQ
jgi:hypothetical protein